MTGSAGCYGGTWRSHEDVPPAGVPRVVELGSRRRCQVRLPEHGEESEGKAHPQDWTEGPGHASINVEVYQVPVILVYDESAISGGEELIKPC